MNAINKKMDVSFGELYRKTCHKITLLKDKGYHVIEMWENKWRRGYYSSEEASKTMAF